MDRKRLYEDIFAEFPEAETLFEDFLDGVSDDEIGDEVEAADKEDETSVENYPHYIEWEVYAVGRNKSQDMLAGGLRMFNKRVLPMMRLAEPVLESWKVVLYARGLDIPQEGAWSMRNAYEYFSYMQKNRNNPGFIRLYFCMKEDEPSVRDCLKLLLTFLLMTKQLKKMTTLLNLSHPWFTFDGKDRNNFAVTDDIKCLTYKIFYDNKSERRIRAWVKALNPRQKALKILSSIIAPINDYMQTGLGYSHTNAKFIAGEDKCLISPYRNKSLLVIVPFGKEVTVRSGNRDYDTECVFRVDGKLNMRHTLSDRDEYRHNSTWDVSQLDPEYEHVTLECQCNYYNFITQNTSVTTIDIAGRSIRELIIAAEELYCASEEDLRRVINIKNAQNVDDIKYIVKRNFNHES